MMRTGLLTPDEIVKRVEHFLNDRTGMIRSPIELAMLSGNAEICTYTANVCDPNQLYEAIEVRSDSGLALAGAGSSTVRELARAKASCEALERYCTVVYNPDDLIVATREELGAEAVDLELFPRGSEEEYRNPHNFCVPPNNKAKIRWARGYSLVSGATRWVPAVAVYISNPFQYPGETFLLPITTGCALAASYEQAIISGLCEVVERDALMLTWLQQLPLPRIDVSSCKEPLFWERMERVERAGFEQYFFDATTDLGLCTIYALQLARHGPLGALVMAATRLDPIEAMIKVMDEAAPSRLALEQMIDQPPIFDPANYQTFTHLTDGAVFYGRRENLTAFDFLLEHDRRRSVAELPFLATGDTDSELERLLDIFQQRQLEVLVVDLTVPQLREVGLYVVKVIVPQLMPLITNHNMRFTMTPRLYEAPARMGHTVRGRHELNPRPQPFA